MKWKTQSYEIKLPPNILSYHTELCPIKILKSIICTSYFHIVFQLWKKVWHSSIWLHLSVSDLVNKLLVKLPIPVLWKSYINHSWRISYIAFWFLQNLQFLWIQLWWEFEAVVARFSPSCWNVNTFRAHCIYLKWPETLKHVFKQHTASESSKLLAGKDCMCMQCISLIIWKKAPSIRMCSNGAAKKQYFHCLFCEFTYI